MLFSIQALVIFFEQLPNVRILLEQIIQAGGVPYLVGGVVRDIVLGKPLKDLDIEVHGITLDQLQTILATAGHVRLVGKQFGVLRIDGMDIDWSLPRRDSKGRKPVVEIDPHMSIEEACRRRDLTMNAMMLDLREVLQALKTGEPVCIIDPYHGIADIKAHNLRAVDATLFLDDPLRFYRVVQFIGRFEMHPDAELTELCKKIDLTQVARERIFEELCKLFLQSRRPSLGIRWLKDIGRLDELMPEVGALVGVYQRPDYHPEGDVFEHTMQALDAAAMLPRDVFTTPEERLLILWTVLCHDLGKANTTDENGSAFGHETTGVPLAKTFLKRFTDDVHLIKAVGVLVRHHLAPGQLVDADAGPKAYRRLALKLAPEVTAHELGLLALCDMRGCNAVGPEPLSVGQDRIDLFWQHVKEAQVEHGPVPPVLQGRDLLGIVSPGPQMGELLKKAYQIQIDEEVTDKEELMKRILS